MRKTKRKFAAMVLCVLSLTTSAFPQMNVYAASASIEYTGGIGLTDIVQQLNQQLGIDSMVENWTFYTTGNAELDCAAFLMDYTDASGKTTTYNMMNYMNMGSKDSDAYRTYENYMNGFAAQESTGYFPINTNRKDVDLKTVDMGDVYYNIQTPMRVEGTSHTVIKYYGEVRWTSFLDCIGVGVSVNMQCRGIIYTVNFVTSADGNSSTDHESDENTNTPEADHSSGNTSEENDIGGNRDTSGEEKPNASSGSSNAGNGSNNVLGESKPEEISNTQGTQSTGGNNSTGSNDSSRENNGNGQSGISYQAKMYDSSKSPQEQPDAIVPGRSSMNSDTLLHLTASTESVPTIQKTDEGKPSINIENDKEEISDLSVEDTEYQMAFQEYSDSKWKIYSLDNTLDQKTESAGKIFQAAMLGVAGIGLLRLLFLFGKLKRGT